ncbi:MAG: tetratricopeptide repeat protein [Bryobacteraceae bacterium]
MKLAIMLLAMASVLLCQEDLAQLYSEAKQSQAAGDLAAAGRKYEAIVRLRPQMAEAYANLGNLYYEQGQTERAKTTYEKAARIKPDLAGPQFFLGVIAFTGHDYLSAARYLRRAEELEPSNSLVHGYLGYTQFARSVFQEAADELEKALAVDSSDIDVLYHLSKSYGNLAKELSGQLQSRFPNSPYTNLARAHYFETAQDWKGTSEQYRLALEKMPDSARLREKSQWAASKAADAGTKAEAGAADGIDELMDGSLAYRDAAPSGSKLREELALWRTRVHALPRHDADDKQVYLAGEGYRALSYLASLAVFESDPDSYRAHQLRAQMLESSNKDEDAIAEYRSVLKRKPELQNIHFAIGSLFWKDQHFDLARAELQQELRINPNHPEALYELGDIASSSEDARQAEKYLLAALKLEPKMVEAHYALEKIYTEKGLYEKSLEHLKAALRTDSSDPKAHYRLSAVYRKLGRTQDAEKELALFKQSQTTGNQMGASIVK